MFLIFAIVWSLFGSSEVQWWNLYWENDKTMKYKRIQNENETNGDDFPGEGFELY